MPNFKEGQTVSFKEAPEEIREFFRQFVRMCTFRRVPLKEGADLNVQFTRQGEGWLFVCRVCPDMECTGYVLDKTTWNPKNKKQTPAKS